MDYKHNTTSSNNPAMKTVTKRNARRQRQQTPTPVDSSLFSRFDVPAEVPQYQTSPLAEKNKTKTTRKPTSNDSEQFGFAKTTIQIQPNQQAQKVFTQVKNSELLKVVNEGNQAQEVRAQEVQAQEVRAQEVRAQRAQEVRAQEVRAQEVRAQEVRAQEVRAQEVRAQEVRAQEVRAQEQQKHTKADGDQNKNDSFTSSEKYIIRMDDWLQQTPLQQSKQIQETYGDDIMLRTTALQEAANSLGLDLYVLCTLLLDSNIKLSSHTLPDKGQLQYINKSWYLTTTQNQPRITDHLWLLLPSKNSAETTPIPFGFLNSVRKIDNSGNLGILLFEIKLSGLKTTDMRSYLTTEKHITTFDVLIEPFSLEISSACSAMSSVPDVIATFVQKDTSGLLFHELVANGATFKGQTLPSEMVPLCLPGECVAKIREGLKKRMEQRLLPADLQRVWATQQKRQQKEIGRTSNSKFAELEEIQSDETYQGVAASSSNVDGEMGKIVSYEAYLRSVAEFRDTFKLLVNSGVKSSDMTTDHFITPFIVPLSMYEEAQKTSLQNWALVSGSLDNCKTSLLVSAQEQLFRGLLYELNVLAQVCDTTTNPSVLSLPQICAISWLLFYSQLPVFVAKLSMTLTKHLQEMKSTHNIGAVIIKVCESFMNDIFVTTLASLLPSTTSTFEKFETDIVFYMREYIDPVSQAVQNNLKSFLSHSSHVC